MNTLANKDNWVSISEINKHCFGGNYFVKTPKTKVEFFKHNNESKINITNWKSEHKTHVAVRLEKNIVDGKTVYYVSQHKVNLGYLQELLQCDTFNTILGVKEFLKSL